MVKRTPDSLDALMEAIADGQEIDWEDVATRGRLDPKELAAARAVAGLRASSQAGDGGAADRGVASSAERPVAAGFELLEELGRGSFGIVWRARDRRLQREVALKVIHDDGAISPEQRAAFLREARSLAACPHENIVRIHSVDERDGRLELCLERIDGITLEELVRENGPLSAEEAARIGEVLCRALAKIHGAGLVHRDVKPANVMREQGGRIVLLDFGLAHSADPARSRDARVGGTPLFLAPELLAPERVSPRPAIPSPTTPAADPRVDLYALGVTLYWLVSRRTPYEAADRDALIEQVARGAPVALLDRRSDLPREFLAVVERATARDPARRFQRAGEMEAALRALLGPVPAAHPAPISEAPQFFTRSRLLLAVGAALITFGGLSWWRQWQASKSSGKEEHGPPAPPFRRDDAGKPLVATVKFNDYGDSSTKGSSRALANGATVHPKDRLTASVTTDRPTWVYAFNIDSENTWVNAFPLEATRTSTLNPIERDVELPGRADLDADGVEDEGSWKLDPHGSTETFVVVMADAPVQWLEDLHRAIVEVPADGAVEQKVVQQFRSITSVAPLHRDGKKDERQPPAPPPRSDDFMSHFRDLASKPPAPDWRVLVFEFPKVQ